MSNLIYLEAFSRIRRLSFILSNRKAKRSFSKDSIPNKVNRNFSYIAKKTFCVFRVKLLIYLLSLLARLMVNRLLSK